MRIRKAFLLLGAFLSVFVLVVRPAAADSELIGTGSSSCAVTPGGAISCTGAMDTSEDVFLETFTVSGTPDTITIQTYGFGGGTNAAGTIIPDGGFDSLIGLFSGTPSEATILTDGGNPIASADNFYMYSPGCGPAGTMTVGTVTSVCGDNTLTATLGAGTYVFLLTDANFVPIAVNPGGYPNIDLTDATSNTYGTGFGAYNDLSSGVFQTCVTSIDCNTDNGNFAVDITGLPPAGVPEPTSLVLAGSGLTALVSRRMWIGLRGRGEKKSVLNSTNSKTRRPR